MTVLDGPQLREELLKRVHQSIKDGNNPVVVFDLDGTLFDNGPRTWHILAEFAETHGHVELRKQLDGFTPTGLAYLMTDTFDALGINDQGIIRAAQDFWRQRFFTDDYQVFDIPGTGAVPFARAMYEAGASVIYLTGRDVPGMASGCLSSLRRHGFPVGLIRTGMVLKPDFETADIDFKTEAVDYIDSLGEVVGSFDNEPANCNLFLQKWPNALTGLIETQHAPGAPALDKRSVRFSTFG